MILYIYRIYRTTLQPSLQYQSVWNQNPPKLLCLEKRVAQSDKGHKPLAQEESQEEANTSHDHRSCHKDWNLSPGDCMTHWFKEFGACFVAICINLLHMRWSAGLGRNQRGVFLIENKRHLCSNCVQIQHVPESRLSKSPQQSQCQKQPHTSLDIEEGCNTNKHSQ